MDFIENWAAERKKRKQARYERNKIAKIAHFSKRYGIKEQFEYRFDTNTLPGLYLDLLKKSLLRDRITMLGEHKLDTLRYCVEDCLKNDIDGDIIETGVWKGGATIYFTGILKAHGVTNRKVFVADSFAGLPPPDAEKWPQDRGDTHHTRDDLAIGLEEVQENFRSFNLLLDNVIFIKGFFEDSLPSAKIEKLSVLRLDGDMYGSTMTALEQLYHKLEIGGYLILDDWLLQGARDALLDFRKNIGIIEPMHEDYSGVFWQKTMPTEPPEPGTNIP
jgi:hypothetical protein